MSSSRLKHLAPTSAGLGSIPFNASITTDSLKVFFKGGCRRCSGRFFFHFDIFRLITRGLIRLRRSSVALVLHLPKQRLVPILE